MKHIFLFFMFVLLIPGFAVAEDNEGKEPINIVVVDIQQLMSRSKAAKSIQNQAEDLREKYQSKIEKLEKKLKDSEKKLIDARKEGDREKFEETGKNFQKDLVDSRKQLAELNQKLDQSIGEALNKLRDEIVEIIGEMATKHNYDLVISRADVIIVAKAYDITAAVLEKLDDTIKKIKVKG